MTKQINSDYTKFPREIFGVRVPVRTAATEAMQQKQRYARRRGVLLTAVRDAGFTVEHSEAGLYLWVTRREPGRQTLSWLADRGILVAPGEFYGPRGAAFVRIALTATDERVDAAAARLAS